MKYKQNKTENLWKKYIFCLALPARMRPPKLVAISEIR